MHTKLQLNTFDSVHICTSPYIMVIKTRISEENNFRIMGLMLTTKLKLYNHLLYVRSIDSSRQICVTYKLNV